MAAPVVTTIGQKVLLLNESISASALFSVTDADGDFITRYRFKDTSSTATTGFFQLGASSRPNGALTDILHTSLSSLSYVAGSQLGTENIEIEAFDGTNWSSKAILQIIFATANLNAPVVTVTAKSILANEIQGIASSFSASDPDGWPILRYRVREVSTGSTSGYLLLGNTQLTPGAVHTIEAADIAQLRYSAVRDNELERISIQAFDGAQWSAATFMDVTTLANRARPAVYFGQKNVTVGKSVGLTDIMTWFDSDGNTAKRFQVLDTSDHAFTGKLNYQGVDLAAKVWHNLPYDRIEDLKYVGAAQPFEESIRYRIYDGRYWSNIGTLVLNNIERPRINYQSMRHDRDLKDVLMRNMFTKADTGPAFTTYEVVDLDGGPNSGRLWLGQSRLNENQVYTLTPTQFNQLVFRTGRYEDRFLDSLYVRATNGLYWTQWAKTEFRTEPEYKTTMRVPNDSINGVNDWNDWNDTRNVVTYSFMQDFPPYETGPATGGNFAAFTAAQRLGTRQLFINLEDFLDVNFVEVPDSGTNQGRRGGYIRMANNWWDAPSPVAPAWTANPDDTFEEEHGGDIHINTFVVTNLNANWNEGQSNHLLMLSLMSAAIGLQGPGGVPALPPTTRNRQFTVQGGPHPTGGIPATMQLYDMLALQDLYGPNTTTRTGDDFYNVASFFNGNQNFYKTLWDAGGNDTISGDDSAQAVSIDLREASFSSIGNRADNLAIAFGVQIENAIGSQFNDTLFGNHLNNILDGGAGNDELWGNGGNDTLRGRTGNDTYRYSVGGGITTIEEGAVSSTMDTLVIDGFTTLNNISQDVFFRREGLDLIIDLTLDRGEPEGSVRIVNQKWGGHRIERLQLGAGAVYDLTTIYNDTTAGGKYFQTAGGSSAFGLILAPEAV